MDQYLDSGSSTRGKGAASSRSAPAAAAPRANNSRLSTLLAKPRPAPARGLDVAVIDGLSVGDGEPAAKRSRRLPHSSGGGGGNSGRGRGAVSAADAAGSYDAECLDVTASPPQRTTGRPAAAAARSSRGGRDVSDGFAARFGNSASNGGRNGFGGATGGAKRKSSAAAASWGSSIGGSGSSSSRSKMGPWARRPEEKAICAEEGYEPLELMEDANREIFGNDSFRGIQEQVSDWSWSYVVHAAAVHVDSRGGDAASPPLCAVRQSSARRQFVAVRL